MTNHHPIKLEEQISLMTHHRDGLHLEFSHKKYTYLEWLDVPEEHQFNFEVYTYRLKKIPLDIEIWYKSDDNMIFHTAGQDYAHFFELGYELITFRELI